MLNVLLGMMGRALADYLCRPSAGYRPIVTNHPRELAAVLRAGDVLLVEGDLRFSTVIKYLTQSRWSHAALYVGDLLGEGAEESDSPMLVEADLVQGVRAVPLNTYASFHVRICRPVGLSPADLGRVIEAVVSRIGQAYDLKNVMDLARYLLPIPVPKRWRRTMLELGSGEPTKAICSTLIAQAFQAVRYPILPGVTRMNASGAGCAEWVMEILHSRHHSLCAPCDFDLSPYFQVVKPTVEAGFDYKSLRWADQSAPAERVSAAEWGLAPSEAEQLAV